MSEYERTDRILARASRGEANAAEIEECIAATRADLDRNLSAVEQRLSMDELIHQAVGYLRAGPTEFLSNFGQTVKANPVPIALLSVSLGWLMLAGRGSSGNGRAAYSEGAYGGTGWAGDGSYDDGVELGSDERGASSDSGMSGAVRRARESMGNQAADLSERTSRLGDQATDFGHRVTGKISEARSKMSDVGRHGQDVFQSARDSIARARSTISQQPRRVREGYQDLAEHHPFVVGAIAFTVGAALAASLRRTHLEDGTMGELRDEVLDKAEDRARSGLQRGMESVQTTLTNSEGKAEIGPDGEKPKASTAQHASEQNDQDGAR